MKNSKTYLAFVILALAAGYLSAVVFRVSDTRQGFSDVFRSQFSTYPNTLTDASRGGESASSELADMMDSYEEGNHAETIKKMTRYIKNHPNNHKIKFYRGISYLNNNEYSKAIKDFQDVILAGAEYRDDAEWYLALAYLNTESKMTALEHFKTIAEKQNEYSAKAREAIAELKTLRDYSLKKVFEMTNDGRCVYFYPKEENPVLRPVTERTLYLEASASGIIPSEISYNEFNQLPVAEKQNLLKSSQNESYMAMSPGNRELYEAMMAALPKPAMVIPRTEIDFSEIAQGQEGFLEMPSEDSVESEESIEPEVITTQAEEKTEDPKLAESRMPLQLGLPWIIDAMLRPEAGKELPDEFTNLKENKTDNEVSWVVDLLTNKISD